MCSVSSASKIQYIVRIRQMLCRWRRKAAAAARFSRVRDNGVPADVPSGHLAVYVGKSRRRFVIRTSYLNSPAFRSLLSEAEAEYGYNYVGPLVIPCDESVFEQILRFIAGCHAYGEDRSSRYLPAANSARVEHQTRCVDARLWLESRPLLNGVAERSVV